MKLHTVIFSFCIAALIAAVPSLAWANPAQAFDKAWNLCAQQTAATERRMAIPQHLLKAISLAESGRWNELNRENVAWPWTVTAGGQGRFFDTQAEALAEVEILMTEGVRNIDVGCMQINLYYHGGAFEGLEEAFDPRSNTAYAASYLKNMFSATGNWLDAAGYYHSTTPELGGPYKDKVVRFWRQQGGRPQEGSNLAQNETRRIPKQRRLAPIDHARMARLNETFKARVEQTRATADKTGGRDPFAAFRAKQLRAWQDARSRGIGVQHLIAMRRAELALKRKREMDRLVNGDPKTRFAARRVKQLRDWRMKVAGQVSLP